MRKAIIIILLSLVLGIFSCKPKNKVKIIDYTQLKKDSIQLDIPIQGQFTPALRNSIAYVKEGYFARLTPKSILFYDTQGKLTDSFSVNNLPAYSFYTWFASDKDHFYFLNEQANTITLIGKNTYKTWDLNTLDLL